MNPNMISDPATISPVIAPLTASFVRSPFTGEVTFTAEATDDPTLRADEEYRARAEAIFDEEIAALDAPVEKIVRELLGGDADVRPEHHLQATGDAEAVDRADDGLEDVGELALRGVARHGLTQSVKESLTSA